MGKRVTRLDGHGIPEILHAILELFPLDTYVDTPVHLMEVVPGDTVIPVIWETYKDIIQDVKEFGHIERFAFYEQAKKAYAIVSTSESALYANLILKKGVIT